MGAADVLSRLQLVGELADLRSAIARAGSAVAKLTLTRRAAVIRAQLLGGGLDRIDVTKPVDALRRISGRMAGLSPDDRVRAGAYASAVARHLDLERLRRKRAGESVGDDDAWDATKAEREAWDEAALELERPERRKVEAERFLSVGRSLVSDIAGPAKAAAQEFKAVAKSLAGSGLAEMRAATIRVEFAKRIAPMAERQQAINAELQAMREPGRYDSERSRKLRYEFQRLNTRRSQAWRQLHAEIPEHAVPSEAGEKLAAAREKLANIGRAMIGQLRADSPVSEADAKSWADAQVIEPAARARLVRDGYPIERVRADMADFYRLTGGRMSQVTIATAGGQRAHTTDVHGYTSSVITMGASFDRQTLFHEMAHHLERDPVVRAAANGFLLSRRKSDRPVSIRSLTGNKGYKPSETAFEGDWFDPYVGKHYGHGTTEVVSMGVESLADPFTLADRMARDPEHFALIAGMLRGKPDPMLQVLHAANRDVADGEQERKEAAAAEANKAVGALAETVKLDTHVQPPELLFGGRYGAVRLVGSLSLQGTQERLFLFEATKVRDPQTKRAGRGFVILHQSEASQSLTGSRMLYRIYPRVTREKAIATLVHWAKTGDPYLPRSTAELKAITQQLASR